MFLFQSGRVSTGNPQRQIAKSLPARVRHSYKQSSATTAGRVFCVKCRGRSFQYHPPTCTIHSQTGDLMICNGRCGQILFHMYSQRFLAQAAGFEYVVHGWDAGLHKWIMYSPSEPPFFCWDFCVLYIARDSTFIPNPNPKP